MLGANCKLAYYYIHRILQQNFFRVTLGSINITTDHTFVTFSGSFILFYFLLTFNGSIVTLRVYLDATYFAENWKHCSKIIFKCMNSVMELIFNEKVARKKKVCGSHEQCTGPTGMYCPPLILLVWTIHWQTKSKRNTSPKKKKKSKH